MTNQSHLECYTAPAKWAAAILQNEWNTLSMEEELACSAWIRSLPGEIVSFVESDMNRLIPQHIKKHDAFEFYPFEADCYEYLVENEYDE